MTITQSNAANRTPDVRIRHFADRRDLRSPSRARTATYGVIDDDKRQRLAVNHLLSYYAHESVHVTIPSVGEFRVSVEQADSPPGRRGGGTALSSPTR